MNKFIYFLVAAITFCSCDRSKINLLENQVASLENQLEHVQSSNTSLLDRLEDLSVINQTEAQSIQESLASLNSQNEFIVDLTQKIQEKDSINFALVHNLKRSLVDLDDTDIEVTVRGGAVYVSIADELLFGTASTELSRRANVVLQKVATVIHEHYEIDVLIEGHTDDIPITNGRCQDNWDLSVLRATSVARVLQHEYGISPERLTAAGKSYFHPKTDNDTAVGRSINRRTEIVLTPRLNQFFDLLEAPDIVG